MTILSKTRRQILIEILLIYGLVLKKNGNIKIIDLHLILFAGPFPSKTIDY